MYWKYLLRQNIVGYVTLSLVYFLLFLVGDLTENLDVWIGTGTTLTAIFRYLISAGEIYIRVSPFLLLVSTVILWSRAAHRGELTAVEAAGFAPWIHFLPITFLFVLVASVSLWHFSSGYQVFADLGQRLDLAASGQLAGGGAEIVRRNGQTLFGTAGETSAYINGDIANPDTFCSGQGGYNVASNRSDRCELPPLQLSAGQLMHVPKPAIPLLLAVFPMLALGSFFWIVRHGRQGGLAFQMFSALSLATLGWVAVESLANFVPPPLQYGLSLIFGVGFLTSRPLWRTMTSGISVKISAG